MSLVQEFKAFIMRGNVIDMAVGVIMGGAFQKIVSSLVADILTPPIGYLTGGVKFENLHREFPRVTVAGVTLDPVTLNYGKFLQASFDFIIMAICVFLMVKLVSTARATFEAKEAAAPPPEAPADVKLLAEIRDLLKAKS